MNKIWRLSILLSMDATSDDINQIKDKFRDFYLYNKFEEDLNDDLKTASSKRKCLYQAYLLANSL